jgi:hypothetical protein
MAVAAVVDMVVVMVAVMVVVVVVRQGMRVSTHCLSHSPVVLS